MYNKLPEDAEQPYIEPCLLRQLADIFVEHRAHTVFGIHLAHSHFNIPEGEVLVGEAFTDPPCSWTKPTATTSLDLKKIYGHTFILTEDGFRPYEYYTGNLPNMANIDHNFVPRLASFLETNKLNTILALEVLAHPLSPAMMELILGSQGTVMIAPERLKDCIELRQTGWAFTEEYGTPLVDKDGKQHHGAGPRGHVIAETSREKIKTLSQALSSLERCRLLS